MVEQKQPANEIKDADTPEFAGKPDPQTQQLIADFEKKIEELKKNHQNEL